MANKAKVKRQPPAKYTLTLTRSQAQSIARACETVARLQCGQIQELLYVVDMMKPIDRDLAYAQLDNVKATLFPELARNASYGVGNRQCGAEHDLLWDVYQVIRFKLAWDDIAEGKRKAADWGVDMNSPMRYGDEPLATIERLAP